MLNLLADQNKKFHITSSIF